MNSMDKAEKALKSFLKELKKNGFNKGIKKHLNLIWQEAPQFNRAIDRLKDIKFKVGDFKFVSHDQVLKIFRFEVLINEEVTNMFVQPLTKEGKIKDVGHFGVIPVKLMKFASVKKDLDEAIKEHSDIIKEERYKEEAEILDKEMSDSYNEKTTPFSDEDKVKISIGEQPDGDKID